MTDTSQTAAPKAEPTGMLKFKIALGMVPEPSGRPSFIWLERWDSKIVALMVAFGVPLLAYSNFAGSTKWFIATMWFAIWPVFYTFLEGRELVGQMQGRGSIKPEQLAEQQNSAQYPYFGVIAACVVWLVVWAVHVALQKWPDETAWLFITGLARNAYRGFWTTPIPYGVVEWFIIVQAWVGTRYINYVMYNTGNIFSKAAPMGERIERRAPH